MAYLSKEELKKMRDNIKKVFPAKEGWKMSIRNRNHSTVCVDLLKGNFKDDEASRNINHYRVPNNDAGKFTKFVNEILELSVQNHDRSDIMTDYFDVGYYKTISIGRWDKEYVYTGKTVNWDEINKRVNALKIIETLKKD